MLVNVIHVCCIYVPYMTTYYDIYENAHFNICYMCHTYIHIYTNIYVTYTFGYINWHIIMSKLTYMPTYMVFFICFIYDCCVWGVTREPIYLEVKRSKVKVIRSTNAETESERLHRPSP